ncbi:MAG TPA: 5'-methylthioadenosine/S-adenosylhomocysteine nucleosidase [Opitutaceae bacterium]|nr:5'-methylthioadenosine/S-adenosylhomocysteine nucleosidase [Opitutaceae bacterium]
MRVVVLCWLLFTASAAAADKVDLLLVAADDALLQPVIQRLQTPATETHAAWTFWRGTLAGKTVLLARSEGDPLNAVAATTLAIRLHSPRLIVTYGLARPHDPALKTGDLVASESFAAFDGMVSQVTALDHGIQPLHWETLPHLLMTPGENERPAMSFPADASALKVALSLALAGGQVKSGVLGSANQVNREADRVAWLHATWHTATEDGESAHIAGCAALLGVPVIGLRVVDGKAEAAADFALRFAEAWR